MARLLSNLALKKHGYEFALDYTDKVGSLLSAPSSALFPLLSALCSVLCSLLSAEVARLRIRSGLHG
jgi:hypothetical protein